jgi:hypothetical protein
LKIGAGIEQPGETLAGGQLPCPMLLFDFVDATARAQPVFQLFQLVD